MIFNGRRFAVIISKPNDPRRGTCVNCAFEDEDCALEFHTLCVDEEMKRGFKDGCIIFKEIK